MQLENGERSLVVVDAEKGGVEAALPSQTIVPEKSSSRYSVSTESSLKYLAHVIFINTSISESSYTLFSKAEASPGTQRLGHGRTSLTTGLKRCLRPRTMDFVYLQS